nr:hypothetical protein [Tanacetum cinerariifolium]
MKDLEEMFSKLNPMAKEFVPRRRRQIQCSSSSSSSSSSAAVIPHAI